MLILESHLDQSSTTTVFKSCIFSKLVKNCLVTTVCTLCFDFWFHYLFHNILTDEISVLLITSLQICQLCIHVGPCKYQQLFL